MESEQELILFLTLLPPIVLFLQIYPAVGKKDKDKDMRKTTIKNRMPRKHEIMQGLRTSFN
jgi:hypothetical protein